MNTLLFFVSSTRRSCLGRLDGILRHLTKHGWCVQVVERAFHKADVRETLKRWTPDGIIVECGSDAPCVIRRKSTRYVRKIAGVAKTGAVARGLDFIQTDAGSGYCGRVFGEVLKWLSQEHEGCFVS